MSDKTFYNQKNVERTIELLSIVIDTLNSHNIRYYLDFGTLIGMARNGKLIPWDDDIDISLFDEDDYSKIPLVLSSIKKRYRLRTYLHTFKASKKRLMLSDNNENLKDVSFTHEDNYQIAKVRDNKFWIFGRGNCCIDIFFKYKHNNNSYWMAYGKENSVPQKVMCEELISIDFYGIKCTIPKEYDKYLTYKYGDWEIPNESWSHDKDDFSILS